MIGFASFPVLGKTTVLYNDSCDNIIFKNGEETSEIFFALAEDEKRKCNKDIYRYAGWLNDT